MPPPVIMIILPVIQSRERLSLQAVSGMVHQVAGVAERSSATAREVATAALEVSAGTGQVSAEAGNLLEVSRELQTTVARFQV